MLADLDTAPIEESLRATLRFLQMVTREPTSITPDDVRAVLATGVTKSQLQDALSVCFVFNVIDRLADTFEFHVPEASAFEASAKMLLTRGYKM